MARLIIRADATPELGAGHVMRCLVLADAWVSAGLGSAHVHGELSLPFVLRQLRDVGAVLHPADLELEAGDVLVVDSYAIEVREELSAARASLRVIVDDTGGAMPEGTDVIWNPNPYGRRALYPNFGGTLLTGERMVPLRAGLPTWRSLGTGTAVALGGSAIPAPLRQGVERALADEAWHPVTGVGTWLPPDWRASSPDAPWNALASSARVVVGAGTSTWEAAAIGIPAVVVLFAPNQHLVYDWVVERGAAAVNVTGLDADGVASRLRDALVAARPLLPIANGASRVAATLHALAQDRLPVRSGST